MLCLAHEVCCNKERVGIRIGQNEAVRGAGNHVDANATKEDALGLCHELVARTHQNIRRWKPKETKSHGCDALHAAHGENFVSSTKICSINDGRVDPDFRTGRGTGRDMLAACDLGGRDSHDRARNVAIAATRYVATRSPHRDGFLTCDQTRNNFKLHICHC